MAEPIEMPFGKQTRVSPGNLVLDEGPDHHYYYVYYAIRQHKSTTKYIRK